MHECSRRQDYTLDSIPFNTLRYVPRLFEGFVALPEPFRIEEFYPFSQRFPLLTSFGAVSRALRLTISNGPFVRSLFCSSSSFSLWANMLNLNALVPTRKW